MSGWKVCVDVGYRADGVVAALVAFRDWPDEGPVFECRLGSDAPAPSYQSGEFYRREMPYILEALRSLPERPEIIVVDGYVWLDQGRPGLGARLHAALDHGPAVIGVAKRRFRDAAAVTELLRGGSTDPLYVSAAGIDLREAVDAVARMHGPHRIPTLLRRVDRLSREVAPRARGDG